MNFILLQEKKNLEKKLEQKGPNREQTMPTIFKEKFGNYVIEFVADERVGEGSLTISHYMTGRWCVGKIDAPGVVISQHTFRKEAITAMRRYKLADKRRLEAK